MPGSHYFACRVHSPDTGVTLRDCCTTCVIIEPVLTLQEGDRNQLEPQHDSDNGSTVTCSRAAAPKLQLDYDKVLRRGTVSMHA